MKTLKIVILGLCPLLFGCKSYQYLMPENTQSYNLSFSRTEVLAQSEDITIGKMSWNKKANPCLAEYLGKNQNLCLVKVDKQLIILDNNQQIAVLSNEKRTTSELQIGDDLFLLAPKKGAMMAFKNDIGIARISHRKRQWSLEMAPEFIHNEVLKAALLYKDAIWKKQNSANNDFVVMMALLPL